MKKLVILGGGFAGVNLARDLGHNPDYSITLIDKNNYNFFPPLIYQVAAGFMSPSDISYPFRKLLNRQPRARFRKGTVTRVDTKAKRVFLEQGGSLEYDILIVALGAQPNYFGNREVEQNAYTMKTIGDALAIRNNILAQLEAACAQPPQARAPYLHFVVAGGGASGVELTGILAEMRRDIFDKDYPELEGEHGKLTLVTADPVLLPPMREVSQRYTAAALQKLGVDIIYNDPVTAYDGQTITLKSGNTLEAKSLIWTAGVTAVKLAGFADSCYARGNRLRVDRNLRVIGLEDVYALGDCAMVEGDPDYPNGHPQLGQVAKAQGKYLGKQLGRNSDKPFTYKHKGDMAMIGRLSAVADMPGGRCLHGIPAWIIWVIVHILALVTMKNRVAAAYNWSIAFLTKNQAMRMNIQPSPPRGRRD
ncbi:NAD(P)/FAD-dependent oxidoreductase [uncultured Cardiobacterium sp.]|uniref:NAD(P)/FAD-dependent oxidoreductase n=1 Tax=uncultured Cardiobacterium sp. TaxID=417619 RepID=UPI00262516B8|nr:NAD(P)/FAD-dependent oxidoreductase [uncultured Cardiobacterium sp.]